MVDGEDKALVSDCLGGNLKAFEVLVIRYQKPLFNAALRMTNNAEDARDLTQSAFVKAFQKLGSFDSQYKFFSWIYRILMNETINFLRQRPDCEEISPHIPSSTKSPEDHYLQSVSNERIQRALMKLPFDYRTVIIQRHFEDLSYAEMSFVLNISEKTVKSRLYTARQMLRELLTETRTTTHG